MVSRAVVAAAPQCLALAAVRQTLCYIDQHASSQRVLFLVLDLSPRRMRGKRASPQTFPYQPPTLQSPAVFVF
jgi:hypothetical protein